MKRNKHKERQSTAVIVPGLWTAFLFGRGTLGYDRMG